MNGEIISSKKINEKANISDIAIIIDGNQTTHTGGVAINGFVYVRNSTISGITDGVYRAAQAIPANTVIDSTYLAAADGGGLNAIFDHIVTIGNHVALTTVTETSATDKALAESLDLFRYVSIEAYNHNDALQGSWFFPVAVLQSRSNTISPISIYLYDGANYKNVYILFKSNTVLNCMVSSGFKFIIRGIR